MSLAEFAGSERIDIAARVALLSVSLQSRPMIMGTILGAGIVWLPQGFLAPVVLAAKDRVKAVPSAPVNLGEIPALFPIAEAPEVEEIVRSALGSTPGWLKEVQAMVIPPPEPYIGPGDQIIFPSLGTVGCQAKWNTGNGFLTAGHVAPVVGASVYHGNTQIGTVLYASNPTGPGTATRPDVSVVQLAPGTTFSPLLGHAVAAGPNSAVIVRRTGGPVAGVIMGFCNFLFLPSTGGTYGDTYFTTGSITAGGDSGSAVVNGSNDVVGLVVAGTPGMTTFIQDVRYQSAQILSHCPALAGLSL